MQYRKLQDDDLHALDAFLATHAETSMVLRSNLRKTGMNRRHHPLSGCQRVHTVRRHEAIRKLRSIAVGLSRDADVAAGWWCRGTGPNRKRGYRSLRSTAVTAR